MIKTKGKSVSEWIGGLEVDKGANNLDHTCDELVDVITTETSITTFDVVDLLCGPATGWGVELEDVQCGVNTLELLTAGNNLVNDIFNTLDVERTELLSNHCVGSDWDTLTVDTEETTLVDQIGDGLDGWCTPGDVWSSADQHVNGCLVNTEEDTVVNLQETQELEDLTDLWCNTVGTQDTDNKEDLCFLWDKELTGLCSLTLHTDNVCSICTVLSRVLLCALESKSLKSGVTTSNGLNDLCLTCSSLCDKCTLLQVGFWDSTIERGEGVVWCGRGGEICGCSRGKVVLEIWVLVKWLGEGRDMVFNNTPKKP